MENNNSRKAKWQDFLKYLLIAATIAFISFLFPAENQFNYKYQKGRNWNYEDLIAPFSYALNRSEVEIEAEKQKIKDDFVPIYVKDPSILTKYNLSVDNLDMSHLDKPIVIKDFLKTEAGIHYRKGVLSQKDFDELWQNKKELIVSVNNLNTKLPVQAVGNPSKVRSLIEEEFSLNFPDSIVRMVDFDQER